MYWMRSCRELSRYENARSFSGIPAMNDLRSDLWKIRASLAVAILSTVFLPASFTISQLYLRPDSWRTLSFYVIVLGSYVHVGVFAYVAIYVILLSLFLVLPLLRITGLQFECATRTLDTVKLNVSFTFAAISHSFSFLNTFLPRST